jgi:LPS-assembly protein
VLLASWSLLAQPLWATELVEVGVIPLTDWQPLAIVPKAEADLRCRQCSGKFIDPLASVNIDVLPTEADLEVSADDSEVTEGTLFFSGNVRVQQGYRFVTADEVQIDRQNETAVASGQVTLREPGIVLTGEKIRYDSLSERADLTDAQYVLHTRQLSGTAQALTRQANGDIDITEGAMTFCAPDDPSWVLQASEIDNRSGSRRGPGMGRQTQSRRGAGVLFAMGAIPCGLATQNRALFPDLGSDSRGGIDMTQPIYFNLAPNYDALYRPRHIEERGLLHQAQGRWLSESIGYWEASGGWIGDDSKYQDDNPNIDSDRWLIHTEHKGQFGAAWRTKINFNRVSDPEYVKDIENNRLSAQRQTALQQLGRVDWLGETWQVRVDVEQFQSLADDIRNDYQKMPQITASYRGGQEWLGVQPIFTTQLSHFESDSVRVTGQRLYTEAGLTMPQRWVSGFFTPTVKYRSVSYELDDFPLLDETSPDAGAMMASLDGGLIFERQTTLGGTSMTQTLEPRALLPLLGIRATNRAP